MRRFVLPLLLTLALLLAACAPSLADTDQTTPEPASVSNATPTDDPALLSTLIPNAAGNPDLARTDEQGAIVVIATPLNLGTPADTLDFDIAQVHRMGTQSDVEIQGVGRRAKIERRGDDDDRALFVRARQIRVTCRVGN